MNSGTKPTKARKTRLVGAKASPNRMPDNAGRKSSLLQQFFWNCVASGVDRAAAITVESGFVVRGERLTMRLGQSVSGFVLCVLLLSSFACNSKQPAKETQSVSPSVQQDKAPST